MASHPTFLHTELQKLLTRDLRALCKERGLTGYSKLPKAKLVDKILDWQNTRQLGNDSNASGATAAPLEASVQASDRASTTASTQTLPRTLSCTNRDENTTGAFIPDSVTETPVPRSSSSLDSVSVTSRYLVTPKQVSNNPTVVQSVKPNHSSNSEVSKESFNVLKRPYHGSSTTDGSALKKSRAREEPPHEAMLRSAANAPVAECKKLDQHSRKRFRALIPSIAASNPQPNDIPYAIESSVALSGFFDFLLEGPLPQLQPISFPPSVVQRRHVPKLTLLLSYICLDDLKTCSRVSRLFRYSAYLVAYNQLSRDFQGLRLQKMITLHPVQVTNFWPYLRYRMDELDTRKNMYDASFVGLSMKGVYKIPKHIWTSPDNFKQAVISMRFLLTRLFFDISLGLGFDKSRSKLGCQIIDQVEEVIPNEIWKISVKSSFSTRTFFVVEATCEVIGQHTGDDLSDISYLRSDWKGYIEDRIRSPTCNGIPLGLLEHLQWSNHEEYAKGISKIWLINIGRQGDMGMAKLTVAQRYIMACVVSNSISGPHLTANQMAQEFNGIPRTKNEAGVPKTKRINLFLPAHHHVESVHFNLSSGKVLHPALAIVQTPAREYYILKDNGMQVGCEEDGVAHVWAQLLGCTVSGVVV